MFLSLLFQVGDKVNKGFQPLVEALPSISKPRESGWGRGWLFFHDERARGSRTAALKRAIYKVLSLTPDSTSTVRESSLQDMLPPSTKMYTYFRYNGSLTTPNCDETVIWTVYKQPIKIHKNQVPRLGQGALSHRESSSLKPYLLHRSLGWEDKIH